MKCPGEALPRRAPHCPTSSQAAPEHVVSRRRRTQGARGERRAPGPDSSKSHRRTWQLPCWGHTVKPKKTAIPAETCSRMFTVAPFSTAERRKPPQRPSAEGG